MATFVLSDLHLNPERPRSTDAFVKFLRGPARAAAAIYLLGDLVEYWVGDDMLDIEKPEFVAALHDLSDTGTAIYLMHGNRDFLMGDRFAQATGCQYIPDPYVVDLCGEKTLLMHGDTLCSDDVEYQKFRLQVRDPAWQKAFLQKSYADRIAMARSARTESVRHTAEQPEYIMDVSQPAVDAAMRAAGVHRLIHGHTHRPGHHRFMLDGSPAERIVLGDWYKTASALRIDEQGITFIALD